MLRPIKATIRKQIRKDTYKDCRITIRRKSSGKQSKLNNEITMTTQSTYETLVCNHVASSTRAAGHSDRTTSTLPRSGSEFVVRTPHGGAHEYQSRDPVPVRSVPVKDSFHAPQRPRVTADTLHRTLINRLLVMHRSDNSINF